MALRPLDAQIKGLAHDARPSKRGHGVGSYSTSKLFTSMKKRVRNRFLHPCCCCHLPSQFQPFCGCDAHGLSSPRSRGDQARHQQLPHISPHVIFLQDPMFPDERESHITPLPSRLLLRPYLLGSQSQVHSQRFNTRLQYNSYSIAPLLKPLLQILTRCDRLALAFFSSFIDRRLQTLFLNLSFSMFSKGICHFHQFLVSPIHEGCDVIHKNPQF